ncbi:MAG: 50S ribosomal protein L18 [Candidatus Eutrophobiaceae bacterium]
MNRKQNRLRRAKKTRARILRKGVHRLCVYKTTKHIYAHVISPCGEFPLFGVSTQDSEIRKQISHGGNIEAAALVGKALAERAKEHSITRVAFDRSGFKYHGCVKALGEAARQQGMEF